MTTDRLGPSVQQTTGSSSHDWMSVVEFPELQLKGGLMTPFSVNIFNVIFAPDFHERQNVLKSW